MSRRRLLLQQAAGGGVIPTDVSGLVLWLDADDASSFTYSSGTVVSQWDDKSTSGFHVANVATSEQPSRDSTINSKSVVRFDGNDRLFRAGAQLVNASTGLFTLFVVAKPTSVSGVQSIVDQDSSPRVGQFVRLNGSASEALTFAAGAFTDVGSTVSSGTTYLFRSVRATGTIEMFVDGVSAGSTATSGSPATSSAQFAVGSRPLSIVQPFTGQIAEVVMYNVALSPGDIADIETYLNTKWGL